MKILFLCHVRGVCFEIKKVLFYGIFLSLLLLLFIFSTAFAQTPEITNGLNFLLSTQNADGSWGDDTSSTEVLPATVAVIEAMQALGETSSLNYATAVSWLQSQDLETTDYLSQRIHALSTAGADQDLLLSYLDEIYTGAWGGYRDFEANNFDTTLALHALNAINYSDLDTISYALGYLLDNQNSDGGFGFYSGDDSNVYMTALVLQALNVFNSTFNVKSSIDSAVAYLLTKQNADGGFPSTPSTGSGYILVQFYDGDPEIGGTLIGETTISSIPAYEIKLSKLNFDNFLRNKGLFIKQRWHLKLVVSAFLGARSLIL